VEVRDEGQCIACHERCYERNQQVLDLEHYLDVLERKPGRIGRIENRSRRGGNEDYGRKTTIGFGRG
jgi:hypothetical protein